MNDILSMVLPLVMPSVRKNVKRVTVKSLKIIIENKKGETQEIGAEFLKEEIKKLRLADLIEIEGE